MREDRGFVNFGDVVARRRLCKQCQYASRYVDGRIEGYPNLGRGLRFQGSVDNYHTLKIHKDDVDEFVRRIREYRHQQEKPKGANWDVDEFGVSF